MPDENVALQHNPDGGIPAEMQFGTFRSAEQTMKEAEVVAKAFQIRALQLELYQAIGSTKHLKIEGWQMLAAMYRVTASVRSTRFIQYGDAFGFEATAVAIHVPSQTEISSADAMCLSDEDNWGLIAKYEWLKPEGGGEKVRTKTGDVQKPLQQLRSMAQTRACSKVYSNLLKWVAKMAGFSSVSAEELSRQDRENGGFQNQQQEQGPPRTAAGGSGSGAAGPVISEAQGKRLWAVAREAKKDKEAVHAVLKAFSVEHTNEIPKGKYEAIIAAIQNPNWVAPAPTAQQQPTPQTQQTSQAPQQQAGPAPQAQSMPDTGTNQQQTSDAMWEQVVRSFKGDADKARGTLVEKYGFMGWDQVPVKEQTRIAMKLIEDAQW